MSEQSSVANKQPIKRYRCPKIENQPQYFVGRDTELAALKARLKSEEQIAIAALIGPDGIGKTTLAHKLTYDLCQETGAAQTFRAVLWLTMTKKESLLESLAQQVAPKFVRYPGEDLNQLTSRAQATLQVAIDAECAECSSNRLLLVLDDVRDVWGEDIETVKWLRGIIPANTTILLTTRFESVVEKLGIEPHNRQILTNLSKEAGAVVLAEYLPDAPRSTLEALSETLGGRPLDLKLAAARLLLEPDPLAELENHVAQYQTRLHSSTDSKTPELEQDSTEGKKLTDIFEFSYAALNATEQNQFWALVVLPENQPFDLPLLAALWQVSENEAKICAKRLCQFGLLEVAQGAPGKSSAENALYREGWYKLHPVLKSYAGMSLLTNFFESGPEEYNATLRGYMEHVIAIAEQFDKLSPEKWGQLQPYLPHIYDVGYRLYRLITRGGERGETMKLALRFAFNISRYLLLHREVRAIEWLEMGLTAACYCNDQSKKAIFLNALGSYYYASLGKPQEAIEYHEQALPILQETGDQDGEATTLTSIGVLYSCLEEPNKALECFERAETLFQAIQSPKFEVPAKFATHIREFLQRPRQK
jgi:tetratricopeptide (TPR) repeat protein